MDTQLIIDGDADTPAPIEIKIVAGLTDMADERAVMNAYCEDNPVGAMLMAKVHNLADLAQTAIDYEASVVLVDHRLGRGVDAGELLVTTIQNLRHNAERPIPTIGVCYDPSWKKAFEEAGAYGTINGPVTATEIARLNGMLPSILQKAYQERLSPNYIAHFSDDAIRRIDATGWQRKSIGVWSSKGGVGKSFIAREIAVALGVLCDLRVLIIDADMNCGDLATYLGVSCDRGGLYKLAQLYHANGYLNPLMLTQCITPFVTKRRATNLQVLTGAYKMSMAGDPMLTGERGAQFASAVTKLLDSMNWDFVIWDLGQSFHHPMHLVPLRRNDQNLVVVTAETATSIELMYALPDLTKRVQINPERFNLILNKWDERLGVDAKELVQSLRMPQFARIPMERDLEVSLSLNHRRPLVLEPPGPVSDAIINAVVGLYPPIQKVWESRGGHAKPKKKGWFGFGRKSGNIKRQVAQ